jgi:hypothetical protein
VEKAFFRETPADLANEERAIKRAAGVLHCDGFRKLAPLYPIDFALERKGRLAFWAEVKSRTKARRAFPDYILSVAKLGALLDLQRTTGIPAVLVVGWTDCLGILHFPCAEQFVAVGGRTDRGGANDIEPLAHFPIEAFRLHPWESRP